MQKVLVENEWYEPFLAGRLEDTAYEELLKERADRLFPGFYLSRFRQRISNDYGHAFPQLALIDRDYLNWWLVLLQTGAAPSPRYLSQQVSILRDFRYGSEIAQILIDGNSGIDEGPLHRLLREIPRLFVLVGQPPVTQTDDPDVLVGVAEVFRSEAGQHILRLNGEQPTPGASNVPVPDVVVGKCTRSLLVTPNLLKLVLSDPTLSLGDRISIEVEGTVSEWIVDRDEGEVSLCSASSRPLPVGREKFTLTMGRGGRHRLIIDGV